MIPQITVLDVGGQYCHLIARKVRDLGVYAEVAASDTPASELKGRKGIIISGGPASVYDPSSPTIDPAVLASGIPVLGICYGQQLMSHLLGGRVEKGERGEYGFAQLDPVKTDSLLRGIAGILPPTSGEIEVHAYGPGFSATRFRGFVDTLLVATQTPLGPNRSELRFHFTVRRTGTEAEAREIAETYVAHIDEQAREDIPIWEHKAFVARPALDPGQISSRQPGLNPLPYIVLGEMEPYKKRRWRRPADRVRTSGLRMTATCPDLPSR